MDDLKRYTNQLTLREIGFEGQQKLLNASVLVVGAGGLGCPALEYLAAAGVGKIGIIDGDIIEVSNLNRQILYTLDDLGKLKCEVAKTRLQSKNAQIQIKIYPEMLSSHNLYQVCSHFDIIMDCTDNLEVRYLIDELCTEMKKPMIYAALHKFQLQISVFHFKNEKGKSYAYRDLYPTMPEENTVPTCKENGVLGVVPGIAGVMQAAQALNIILHIGSVLSGKLFIMDLSNFSSWVFEISHAHHTKDSNYSIGKSVSDASKKDFSDMEDDLELVSLAFDDFKSKNLVIIDIRETNETPKLNYELPYIQIPQSVIEPKYPELEKYETIIFFCASGQRSLFEAQKFRSKTGKKEAYSLQGGLLFHLDLFQDKIL